MAITATEMAAAILGFQTGAAVKDTDMFPYINTGDGNTAEKITATLLRAYLVAKITPSVDDSGYLYFGGTKATDSTGNYIKTKGETPHLARDTTGVYYYLDSETAGGTISKHYLVYLTEFNVSLSDLTDAQYNALVNKVVTVFSDKLDDTLDEKVKEATASAIIACNEAADNANTAKESANTAAKNASEQAEYAYTQGARAKEFADNQPKIGENGNWWIYDETSKKYMDSGIAAGAVDFECYFNGEDLEIDYDDQLGEFDYDESTGDLLWTK